LALKKRWVSSNPCKLVDLPVVPESGDIRYLTQDELMAVIDRGIEDSPRPWSSARFTSWQP
jgi:hypothetical protein